jgi:hypothetical protein
LNPCGAINQTKRREKARDAKLHGKCDSPAYDGLVNWDLRHNPDRAADITPGLFSAWHPDETDRCVGYSPFGRA